MSAADELCLALLRAESDVEVRHLLEEAEYWSDEKVWRPVGDNESNYSTIGGQQADPFAALAEKIINSIDAVLVGECRARGIDPEDIQAPQSMREAVANFFEGHTGPLRDRDGRLALWEGRGIDVTSVAKRIMIVASGKRRAGNPLAPNIAIIDNGEGQTPDAFPDTFMSLHRANKVKIQFVQGKWNMGGTGVLIFCSDPNKFQLVISKRDPRLVSSGASDRDRQWGFTLVRKRSRRGKERTAVFEYLAPAGATESNKGQVLSCSLSSLPLYPTEAPPKAFDRETTHGTLIKLYEYEWDPKEAGRGTILIGKSLHTQVECCLPMVALPVRLFEGRDFQSSSAAFNATGLVTRLTKETSNLEPECPIEGELNVNGQRFPVIVFVFSSASNVKADSFIANNGVILAVNGQKHATYPRSFFGRRAVDLSYIRKHLVAVVDCSDVADEIRDDLFMTSRDRLRKNDFSEQLERVLEDFLKKNDVLRIINNRRRQQEIENTLADDAPLVDVIQKLLKQSPLLASFFKFGSRVPIPFPDGGSGQGGVEVFAGKKHPTYFRFRKGDSSKSRDVPLGSRARLEFETDAENRYFSRSNHPGNHVVECLSNHQISGNWGSLHDGAIDYSVLTSDQFVVGDRIELRISVNDEILLEPFVCTATLNVVAAKPPTGRGGIGRRTNPNEGTGRGGGQQRITIPRIIAKSHLEENDWTESTAMTVQLDDGKAGEFFYNKDNKYLKDAQKKSASDPRLLDTRFKFGLALLSLALIDGQNKRTKITNGESGEDGDLADYVSKSTEALAPVLLPMVEALGGIEVEDLVEVDDE